jgi:hypothetical protein
LRSPDSRGSRDRLPVTVPPCAAGDRRSAGPAAELFKINTGDKATQDDTITINDVGYISITMVGGDHDLPVPKVKLTTAATALFKKQTADDKVKDLPKDTRIAAKKTSSGRSQVQVVDGPRHRQGRLDRQQQAER